MYCNIILPIVQPLNILTQNKFEKHFAKFFDEKAEFKNLLIKLIFFKEKISKKFFPLN